MAKKIIKVGSIYSLDGIYYKCTKVRESGVNSFQVCNKAGSKKVIYFKNSDGKNTMRVFDNGHRLISKRTNELKLFK